MPKIMVEGFEGSHEVTENLGYNHDRGCYAKAVMVDGKERIVVSNSARGPWSINRPVVRLGSQVRGQWG